MTIQKVPLFENLNLKTEFLPCKNCGKETKREDRMDCVNEENQEESFCKTCWFNLIVYS